MQYKQLLTEGQDDKVLKRYIANNTSSQLQPYLNTPLTQLPQEYQQHFSAADGNLFQHVSNSGNMNRLVDYFRLQLYKYFDISHNKGPVEYLKGIARIACEELGMFNEQGDPGTLAMFKILVMFLHTTPQAVEIQFNKDLNGMNYSQFKQIIGKARKAYNNAHPLEFHGTGKSEYTIIPIENERQALEYGDYTTWCVTYGSYNSYTQDGSKFYFCLKDGFENITEENGHDVDGVAPFDKYGLSMVSVLVNIEGDPTYVTTRWNHEYDGENNEHLHTAEQVQNLMNVSFKEVFKPWSREELHARGIVLFDEVQDLLDSGKDPREIFNEIYDFSNGYAKVQLNYKCNFIDTNGKLLLDTWLDYAGNFSNGYAKVLIGNKYNFIDTNGRLLSDTGFNDAGNFSNGYAKVRIGNKYNFIDTNGRLLSDTGFDYADNFYNGYAKVLIGNKWNYIDTNGRILSDTWFDYAGNFDNGYAGVKIDGKYNFIDTNGRILSDTWFDNASKFDNGYAKVLIGNKRNFIDTNGKLLLDTWFDDASKFYNGYAKVQIGNKYNFIDTNGRILSDTWFDDASKFDNGYAKVLIGNKYNFIDTNGRILSDTWFDGIGNFDNGYAVVYLDGKCQFIDTNGRLFTSLPQRVESISRLDKLITETINRYLKENII